MEVFISTADNLYISSVKEERMAVYKKVPKYELIFVTMDGEFTVWEYEGTLGS